MRKGQLKTSRIPFDNFSTGLHQRSSNFADATNPASPVFGLKAASDLINVVCDDGFIKKAAGYTKVLASDLASNPIITGVFEYVKEGTSRESFTIVCAGTKVYTVSGGTATQIYSGITAGALFNFATYNGVAILVNGVDAPLQFNGTTCTTITFTDPSTIWPVPRPSMVEVFRNRLFYSGDNSRPYSVFTPVPGTHNDFSNPGTESDEIFISEGDGQRIMAIKAMTKDLLFIAKRGSLHRLSGFNPFGAGADSFVVEEISRSVGCVSGFTVQSVATDIVFLSDNGLKTLQTINAYGDVTQADPMFSVNKEVDNFNYTTNIIEKAFTCFDRTNQWLYLHVPTGSSTTNDTLYVLDMKTGSITKRSGIVSPCGAMVGRKYYTGTYDGNILLHGDNDTYNGSAIESFWESKWIDLGTLDQKKIFKFLNIYFEAQGNSSIIIQWQVLKLDGSVETHSKSGVIGTTDSFDVGAWDSAVFDAASDLYFRKNNLGRGRAIKIRLVNNQADQPWKVTKIELGINNLGKVPI